MELIQTTKWCAPCKSRYPLTNEFWLSRKRGNAVRHQCRACSVANTRRWRARHPEKTQQSNHATKRTAGTRLSVIRSNAKRRGLQCTITKEELAALMRQCCHYCDGPLSVETSAGLDRIDNSEGYTIDNVVPCCYSCNITRNRLYTYEEFMTYIAPAIREVIRARSGI